jgi:AhpD family alkylhydroperoxidase
MRIDLFRSWPDGYRAVHAFEQTVSASGLDPGLLDLVKLRASQLNGCAYCIDMHTKDARACGETEQRLYAVPAWRDAPFFTEPERAALALAEALTELGTAGLDDVVSAAREHFDDVELSQLTYAIALINVWNRLALTAKLPVGDYQPSASAHA